MLRAITVASLYYSSASASSLVGVSSDPEHPFGTLENDQHGYPRVLSQFYWTNTKNFDFVPSWVLGGDSNELVEVTLSPTKNLVGRYFYDIEGHPDLIMSYYVCFVEADLTDMERAYALNRDGDTNAPVAVYFSAVPTVARPIGHGAYTVWRRRAVDNCSYSNCVPVWRLMAHDTYFKTSFRQKATLMKKFIEYHHRYFLTDNFRYEDFRSFTLVNIRTMDVHPPTHGYFRGEGSLSDIAMALLVCFIQGSRWTYYTNDDPYKQLLRNDGQFENRHLVERALFRDGNPAPVILPGEIRGLPATVTFRKFDEVFAEGDEYFGISIELWNAALNNYIHHIEQVDMGATDLIPSLADILDSLIHEHAA